VEHFDPDLASLLTGAQVHVPSLRERGADAVLLAAEMVTTANLEPVPRAIERAISAYTWPGNIPQLRSVVLEYAVTRNEQQLLRRLDRPHRTVARRDFAFDSMLLSQIERCAVVTRMRLLGGNKAKVAQSLGISRRALYDKITRHRIEEREWS
jgi:DNA-binding NtrC family response regulator